MQTHVNFMQLPCCPFTVVGHCGSTSWVCSISWKLFKIPQETTLIKPPKPPYFSVRQRLKMSQMRKACEFNNAMLASASVEPFLRGRCLSRIARHHETSLGFKCGRVVDCGTWGGREICCYAWKKCIRLHKLFEGTQNIAKSQNIKKM